MNSHAKVQPQPFTTEELNDLIIESIQDIKGKSIVKLDMRKLHDAPTDYFIICEGDSNTQVKAIADNIQKRIRQETGTYASHVEGDRGATWVCIDYFTTVAHIFHKEKRNFYELENLWSDARITEYESL